MEEMKFLADDRLHAYIFDVGDVMYFETVPYFISSDKHVDFKDINIVQGKRYDLDGMRFIDSVSGDYFVVKVKQGRNRAKKWWQFWIPNWITIGAYIERIK